MESKITNWLKRSKPLLGLAMLVAASITLGVLLPGTFDGLNLHTKHTNDVYDQHKDDFLNGIDIYNMTHDEFYVWVNINFKYNATTTECEFYAGLWKDYLEHSGEFKSVKYVHMKGAKHVVLLAENRYEYCFYDQRTYNCYELVG